MTPHQIVKLDGSTVIVERHGKVERYEFGCAAEAEARAKFVVEALTWVGTPFRDCADIKGSKGAVDCAMLLVRASVDSGLLTTFDPRPYSPRWMLHRSEEKFLGIIRDQLGAREIASPRFGDVHLYLFGRCFSHGGIRISSDEIVHAYAAAGCCLISRVDEHLLNFIPLGHRNIPRPVRFFDVCASGSQALAPLRDEIARSSS